MVDPDWMAPGRPTKKRRRAQPPSLKLWRAKRRKEGKEKGGL
jgi:hypothetical protein